MWSSPHFVLDENNAVRYLPNEQVREVAVYNDAIEYDAHYQTNNLGLIDNVDYLPISEQDVDIKHIAIVGDSITAGSGASPWVPRLREIISTKNNATRIYNLGVAGAGLEHFYKLLTSIGKTIKFNEIVILAISNDFHRPFWRPRTTSTEIRFCPASEDETTCAKRMMVASVISYDATEAEILAHVAQRQQNRKLLAKGHWMVRGLKYSRFFSLLYDIYNKNPLFAAGEKTQNVSDILKRFVEKDSFRALEKIRREYPDIPIRFLHLPEKHEVRLGRYDLDLRDKIETLGIVYVSALELETCRLSRDMFYPNDPHPNALGYTKISKCVEALLFPESQELSD